MSRSKIIPGAEPFYFPGDKTGCLLVHGFTGVPKEMRGLGEHLTRQGYTVLGIRLSAHATHPDDMLRVHWQDWLADVEDGINLLRGSTDRIFICGLSLGGVLSLLGAARFPVAGVISMSTPYQLPPDPRLKFLRWLQYLQPRVGKGEPDWAALPDDYEHIEYPYYPTRAVIQVRDLLVKLRAALPAIQAPALLIHSRGDQSVPLDSMPQISAQIGSQDKQAVWIENSGHNIVCDGQRQSVFELVSAFIARQVNAKA